MIAPWRTKQIAEPWRLGMFLGDKKPGSAQDTLGWAAVQLAGPTISAEGDVPTTDLNVDAMIRAREAILNGAEAIELYRYGSDASFADSRAAAEGASRGAHNERIAALANEMRLEGLPVHVTTIR